MNPITIPNITIPVIGLPTIGIPSVGFPSASGGGLVWPAGMKEHIKAIYDPALQGMTNYDVIEAYAEDFTNWTLDNSNGIATVTKNEIHITESIIYYRSVVRQDKVRGTQPFKVLISGLTDSQAVQYIYNDGKSYVTKKLTTNGVHELPASSTQRNGFNVEPAGACDVTIKQLPTSMLQDLSGNGNHAYLYGGKGKLNSGMGVYKFDFLSDLRIDSAYLLYTERQDDKICSLAGHPAGWLFQFTSLSDIPAFKVEVKGIVNDKFTYRWYDEKGNRGVDIAINEDGIYELPMNYSVETNTGVGIVCNNICQDNVCFTQLPDYPNQLCYDGKMYAVCYGFPILEDYTVMADRTWFDKEEHNAFVSNSLGGMEDPSNGAFSVEVKSLDSFTVMSFGSLTNISTPEKGITYQTKQSYNGISINVGTRESNDVLTLGGRYYYKNNNNAGNLWNGCHGKIIIADRSFTEDEITWLKDNFFTIDIPTPAYDFDFSKLKSGENTFTDKYGNKLSLHNFAWSGMSGKDGYNEDFTTWKSFAKKVDIKPNSAHVFLDKFDSTQRWILYIPQQSTANSINVKISGLKKGQSFRYYWTEKTKGGQIIIDKNGIYSLPAISSGKDYNGFVADILFEGTFDVTITQLPLYSNALIFDGIDDYASFQKTSKLIKSVIVDFIPLKHEDNHGIIYDQRLLGSGDVFAIYHAENLPAYSARNNGDTYIDGVLNTTLIPEQLTGKHMQVAITNNNILEMNKVIFIGCRGATPSALFYSAMALYRITGFTEVLTPDQVWKWYQKNQPKGGDK